VRADLAPDYRSHWRIELTVAATIAAADLPFAAVDPARFEDRLLLPPRQSEHKPLRLLSLLDDTSVAGNPGRYRCRGG
jgi:hypothetical protein